jgi:hypothetical protein
MINPVDIEGILRDTKPDLGAFEYVKPTNSKRKK